MVMSPMYPSDEQLEQMKQYSRESKLRNENNPSYSDGKVIDGECQEVSVSATGDVLLLDCKEEL